MLYQNIRPLSLQSPTNHMETSLDPARDYVDPACGLKPLASKDISLPEKSA
jgi:hypothetical protein